MCGSIAVPGDIEKKELYFYVMANPMRRFLLTAMPIAMKSQWLK